MQKMGELTDDERFSITTEIDNNLETIAQTYFEAIPTGGLFSRQDIHQFLSLVYGHVGGGQAENVFDYILATFRNKQLHNDGGPISGKIYKKT